MKSRRAMLRSIPRSRSEFFIESIYDRCKHRVKPAHSVHAILGDRWGSWAMQNTRLMSCAFAILIAMGVVLLAGGRAIGDPGSSVKEFPAVRGDRTSGWLAQTR